MSKENYETLQATIEAIADADTKIPNMPVDKFLQEAADLGVWSQEDQPKLLAIGLSQQLFDGLSVRPALCAKPVDERPLQQRRGRTGVGREKPGSHQVKRRAGAYLSLATGSPHESAGHRSRQRQCRSGARP